MRILLTALVTFCVLLPFAALQVGKPERKTYSRVEILDAERQLASSVERRDTQTLEGLLADDVRIVGGKGELLDGKRMLDAVRAGSVPAAQLDHPDVRFYERIALVHGRSSPAGPKELYVLRAWVRLAEKWQLVLDHTTDITAHATADPPTFAMLKAPVHTGATEDAPADKDEEADVKTAIRESHQRYWAKDVAGYLRTVGADLIRAAETGVRPGAELVDYMKTSPHLPRTPSDQLEMWTRVFGNVALGGWLDSGTTAQGIVSRNRFTLALVWRDGRWQIVQIQSTGVTG